MLLVRSVDLPSPNRMGSVFCGGGGWQDCIAARAARHTGQCDGAGRTRLRGCAGVRGCACLPRFDRWRRCVGGRGRWAEGVLWTCGRKHPDKTDDGVVLQVIQSL